MGPSVKPVFTGVDVETWTSFNELHTINNIETVSWARTLNVINIDTDDDTDDDTGPLLIDFGCG